MLLLALLSCADEPTATTPARPSCSAGTYFTYCPAQECDTGCTFYSGPTLITGVEAACDGPRLVVEAHTQGWTADARVNMANSESPTRWDEEHRMRSSSFGANGFWDFVEVGLTAGVPQAEWVPEASTSFDCALDVETRLLTYAVRVWDPDGLFADCRTWGRAPSGYIDGRFDVGVNPVTDAHEFAACTIVEGTD